MSDLSTRQHESAVTLYCSRWDFAVTWYAERPRSAATAGGTFLARSLREAHDQLVTQLQKTDALAAGWARIADRDSGRILANLAGSIIEMIDMLTGASAAA